MFSVLNNLTCLQVQLALSSFTVVKNIDVLYVETMTLISANQISKAFSSKQLFKNISFGIEEGERIGLIGPNGAGKSTLLKIISKKMDADQGKISISNNLVLGYLDQKPVFKPEDTVYEALVNSSDDPYDGVNIALAYELITKMTLDTHNDKEHALISHLSGGLQKRVALARELMKRPNLLLLDEPTNHLDIHSILWLEQFIKDQQGLAVMIITHDRAFLQNTCNVIFDLDPRNPDGLIKSRGSYSQFLETKFLLLEGQKRLEEKKRNTMLIEKEWLARGPQARLTKQKARINRAHDLIEEVDNLENKNAKKKLDFDFGQTANTPKKLIELKDVGKRYSDDAPFLFRHLDGLIRPGSRVGLIGKNGSGKSTLIKVLLEKEPPTEGTAFLNPDIQTYYFEQSKMELNQNTSVLKIICPEGDYVHFHGKPVYGRSYLSRFYFTPQQMDMPVSHLSGGEQSRLLIAKIMLTPAHVLILDEPTNDLDVETLDVLTECLADYDGALILVSHDRFFLDQNSNEIWAITQDENGTILKFADYNQWETWYSDKRKNSSNTEKAPALSQAAKLEPKKKLSFKELHELDHMEKNIAVKEAELKKLQAEVSDPEVASNYNRLTELTSKIGELEKEIPAMYDRWQELEARKS